MDAVLGLLLRPQKQRKALSPKRILLSNIAHLGDVIVATSVLPALKSAYPDAEIGFLIGSWCLPLMQGHPLVSQCHILDHWMHNRTALSRREKWRIYRRTRAAALTEIKSARYDLAIDLYSGLPNTLPLLWQTKIPTRAGYSSAGFGPLATHCLDLTESRQHMSERHRELLRLLGVAETDLTKMAPVLPPVPTKALEELREELNTLGLHFGEYVVFHPGASAAFREWPEERWRELAVRLTNAGHSIVFTGNRPQESALIERIREGLPRCVSLCGKLSWPMFVGAIQEARFIVCVDTSAGHVAGALGKPSAVIIPGLMPYLWRPLGPSSRMLMAPVPCSPCHLNNGCAGMECIQNLSLEQVYQACLQETPC